MGYGGGFYDRTISHLEKFNSVQTIGVAFNEQEVEKVPTKKFDRRLSKIVTPKGNYLMRVLICGDIVGKAGRNAVRRELPSLKKNKKLDFVIVNGENAANGFGITKKYVKNFTPLV